MDKENIIIQKLEKYCSIQERCISDIIKKLHTWEIENKHDQIIQHLKENNFLNEERFISSFCSGKFKIKKWGKKKITYELKKKGLASIMIKKHTEDFNNNEYCNTIIKLIILKAKTIKEKDIFVKKNKIAKYLYQKGFESHLVWELINDEIK